MYVVKKLILEGSNPVVTMFLQYKKQCDKTNGIIFQTCCKNPNFRQVVLNFCISQLYRNRLHQRFTRNCQKSLLLSLQC